MCRTSVLCCLREHTRRSETVYWQCVTRAYFNTFSLCLRRRTRIHLAVFVFFYRECVLSACCGVCLSSKSGVCTAVRLTRYMAATNQTISDMNLWRSACIGFLILSYMLVGMWSAFNSSGFHIQCDCVMSTPSIACLMINFTFVLPADMVFVNSILSYLWKMFSFKVKFWFSDVDVLIE